MRFLVLILVSAGCGRSELPPVERAEQTAAQHPSAGRVRLTASASGTHSGFRFADKALLRTRLNWAGTTPMPEVRAGDDALLTGDEQRTDLQFMLHRFTYLTAPASNLCVLAGPVSSVAQVDAKTCVGWTHLRVLQPTSTPAVVESFAGTGLVIRTETSGVFRLRIVENGFDEANKEDFVVLDYEADAIDTGFVPASGCSPGACEVRENCCSTHAACVAGRCQ